MLSLLKKSKNNSNQLDQFLVSDRKLNWLHGSFSIAASWIWAPALFISTQVTYEMGLAGLFWFTFPNILALSLFAILAPKIRKELPQGTTLTEYIYKKNKSRKLKNIYLIPIIFYQIMAISVQLIAGSHLISLITNLNTQVLIPILLIIPLSYTIISGFKISAYSDVIQLSIILGISLITLPLVWQINGGLSTITSGLQGINQTPFLDLKTAFSFGLVTSIGLISGALNDQQYWQRSFAIQENKLKQSFLFGSLLFGLVPVGLSILGFIAASQEYLLPNNIDPSMIGISVIQNSLPTWGVYLFFIMLLAGLSSTLDSALSAFSSIYTTDIKQNSSTHDAKIAMLIISFISLVLAFTVNHIPQLELKHLWWIFNTIAACTAGPTLIILYKKHLQPNNIFFGILISFFLGIPLFIYANIIDNPILISLISLLIIFTSSISTILYKTINYSSSKNCSTSAGK